MVFGSALTLPTLLFFVHFFQAYVLPLRVSVRLGLQLGFYLLRLLHFYQAYCTLVMCYCCVTGGVLISFQISRSIGVSIATAKP